MAQTFTAYTDVEDILSNGSMAVETASLVGGRATLAASSAAGATALTVNTPTNAFSGTFQLWALDGQQSEAVSGCTIAGTTITVPAPGMTYAHAAGVSLSSAGSGGCLAALITRASGQVETICQQGPDPSNRSLFRQQWTETLSGPNTFRAAFDRDGGLILKPYRFPITAVASVTVQVGASTAATLDTSFLTLPDAAEMIQVPMAQILGSPPPTTNWTIYQFPRNRPFYVTLVYTAGPVPGLTLDVVPPNIREACTLLVMDRLGFRINNLGAAMVKRGDVMYEMRLRGDTTGKSLLERRADDLLNQYVRKW